MGSAEEEIGLVCGVDRKGGHVAAMKCTSPDRADVPTFAATSATCPPFCCFRKGEDVAGILADHFDTASHQRDVPTFPSTSATCPPFEFLVRCAKVSEKRWERL